MNNTPEEFLSAIEVIIDDCEYGKISTGQCLSDIKNCIFVYGKTTKPNISPPAPDDVADAAKFIRWIAETGSKEFKDHAETLIRAASTPSAEVMALQKIPLSASTSGDFIAPDYIKGWNAAIDAVLGEGK